MSGSTKSDNIESNGIVAEVLKRENYSTWKVLMKNYLIGKDLWYGVIEDDKKEAQDHKEPRIQLVDMQLFLIEEEKKEAEQHKERNVINNYANIITKNQEQERRDKRALHAIQLSCGKMLGQIKNFKTAKEAWEHLETSFEEDVEAHLKEDDSRTEERQSRTVRHDMFDDGDQKRNHLHTLVRKGFLEEAKVTIDDSTATVFSASPNDGKTVLHVAVEKGRKDIVKKLVMLGNELLLKMTDNKGYTPLALAAKLTDDIEIAELMVKHGGQDLLTMPCKREDDEFDDLVDEDVDEIPVLLASANGHKEMTRYLFHETPTSILCKENWKYGVVLLTRCISKEIFDVAAKILTLELEDNQKIPLSHKKKVLRPIYALAHMASAFPSSVTKLHWLHRFLYHCSILREKSLGNDKIEIVIQQPVKIERPTVIIHTLPGRLFGRLQQFVQTSILFRNKVFKEMYEKKRDHYYVTEILECLCKRVSTLPEAVVRETSAYDAMLRAGKNGITEFIESMKDANTDLLSAQDKSRRGIFAHAVMNRKEKVFRLIHNEQNKETIASRKDVLGYNLLHIAAELGPSSYLDPISNAALQMQRELQWFREVKKVVPQWYRDAKDPNGKSPSEILDDEHEELLKMGQQWAKETASSFTLVGTLIITVMFAAIFTVPGGNESNKEKTKGLPVFLGNDLFTFFIISDATSIITSSSSVLIFTGMLTSRYAQVDFDRSLPLKLLFGLISLFLSVVSMMCAFCGALALMLKGYNKIVVAAMGLALIPILIFIPSLLRLAIEIFQSTIKFSPLAQDRKKIQN